MLKHLLSAFICVPFSLWSRPFSPFLSHLHFSQSLFHSQQLSPVWLPALEGSLDTSSQEYTEAHRSHSIKPLQPLSPSFCRSSACAAVAEVKTLPFHLLLLNWPTELSARPCCLFWSSFVLRSVSMHMPTPSRSVGGSHGWWFVLTCWHFGDHCSPSFAVNAAHVLEVLPSSRSAFLCGDLNIFFKSYTTTATTTPRFSGSPCFCFSISSWEIQEEVKYFPWV